MVIALSRSRIVKIKIGKMVYSFLRKLSPLNSVFSL